MWYIVPAVCIAVGFLMFTLARQKQPFGHMKVTVVDAYSMHAIEQAQIVLPEGDIHATTDGNGVAYLYSIPLSPQQPSLKGVPCDYGETTILVYAEGYLPFALFHAHVYDGRLRNGPTLYLFPEGTEDGIDVISMIESPKEDWVEQLLDAYAP